MLRRIAATMAFLISLVFLVPGASGHPYHLLISNEVLNTPEPVDSGNWIAQSFLATLKFTVSRVSLYVAHVGVSDNLTVTIRSDAGGCPSTTILSQGAAAGPATAGWLDIDLNPYVPLASANSNWIVAHSLAPAGNGYNWWNSGPDTAYLDGTGVRSADGVAWSARSRDFAFRVYGFLQPALAFSASGANAAVREGSLTSVRVNLSNDGPGTAPAVWVNITLPSELTYVADDAAAAGGTLSGTYSYAFTAVGPGSRSFNVTLRAAAGVANGTSVVLRVAIDSLDHNGAPLAPFVRNLPFDIVGGPTAPVRGLENFWWLIPVPIVSALGTLFIWRRRNRRVVVDEVFVGDVHGILLAHRSVSMVRDQDEDILIGMFKAIQDFVREAFSRGTDEEFHAIDFGERRILIERGRAHFIAVVFRGEDKDALLDRVRKVSRAIDERFGNVIASWNGEMNQVKGIALLLPKVWER